ncbi:hypothetical protein R4L22_06100 [Brachyspira pilosicoli]|uniref:Uncharacterized protein n=1 Tax=Brachyspira pilosicoli TaxID=52584 RepID=A0AAJ6GAV1_BRAPL|nr:hypothetical protein [Brachyspira pilosicoli]MBW5391279.1 hypothetical protein [Brachyspira pilosicoli]MBW5398442.1 hypothetical protein [Brachyspira pilosicoli]WIH83791.1 hypothetical protein NEI00_01090 [Brachyspira pilosicoli]WIH91167.1 hypothetical protein NEI02_04190 [Brachyspira pilosicoli]WIH93458.1 hypothetical protein NEI01_04190 [Brachyspira pilosicoli]
MSIDDKTKSALIRKGNELFNERKIEEAYRCYLTASYFGGIEKIADYYNFESKNFIKAMQLYKFILKEDSNLGGNIRAKQKLDTLSQSIAKVLQKWLNDDETFSNSKTNKLSLDSKNTYLPNNYKRNSLEDILNAKEKLDEEKLDKNKLNKDNNNKINNNDNKIIKKPVFEQIYKNKNK